MEQLWQLPSKINGELFSLTYGALVVDLLKDLEEPQQVNAELDKMGFNIGMRLADDFLAKNTNAPRCTDTRQMAETLAKQALPSYLGTTATVQNWAAGDKEFSLVLDTNPLMELVEIPAQYSPLQYSQLLAGAVRGALEAVHIKVKAWLPENQTNTEIRIRFEQLLKDNLPAGED